MPFLDSSNSVRIIEKLATTLAYPFSLQLNAAMFRSCIWDGTAVKCSYFNHVWDGNWHLAVMVVNASTQMISTYIDAVLIGSTAYIYNNPTSNQDSIFIGNNGAGDKAYHGLIDDVRIYNRALSLDDITAIHQLNTSVNEPSSMAKLSITPNPVGTILKVTSSNDLIEGIVEIISFDGKRLATYTTSGSNDIEIDVSELPVGVYFLRIKSSVGDVENHKFIKYQAH